jgi:integrase
MWGTKSFPTKEKTMAKAFTRYTLKGYKGVFFILGTSPVTGEAERIFYIRYRTPDGKMVEEKAGRAGKPDSMTPAKARAIREDRMRGKELPNVARREAERSEAQSEAERWTFDGLWEEWKKVNADKRSRVVDDNRYRTHLQPLFGDKEPREVLPLEVDRLRVGMLKGIARPPGRTFDPNAKCRADYSEKKKKELAEKAAKRARKRKPYAVGTVVSVLSLLRRIASFGADRRLCEGLSFKVTIPKGAKQKTEDMTGEQMARYIRTCREWPDPQEGNFQILALYTGMRRSELRKLKWADVDLARGFILLRDPKGGEDQRVPMNDATAEILKAHPREKGGAYVFSGEKGGPRGIRQIADSSRAIRDAAGLPKDFRPNHGLRHTFASHLASSGEVDLYTLQKMMTHKSPQMTQRYAHLTDAALKRGANVMSRIVKEAEESA